MLVVERTRKLYLIATSHGNRTAYGVAAAKTNERDGSLLFDESINPDTTVVIDAGPFTSHGEAHDALKEILSEGR